MTPEKVAVVGCGLIGTSVAMAARRGGDEVRGWDADVSSLDLSVSRAGFAPARSLKEATEGAGLVFVCVPTAAISSLVLEVLAADPATVVTDAGSVKSQVVNEVENLALGSDVGRFVGSHPMTGSERSGPDAASPSLLDDAVWVLTPTGKTDPQTVSTLESWVRKVGAKPVVMDPLKHDRVVAIVSHLPQVVSTALMGLATWEQEEGIPETLMLAAGGFRDLTRLAASNPDLWAGILLSNREELARAIDLFVEDLNVLRDHLGDPDPAELRGILAEATGARLALAARPKVRAGVAILQVPIPDRPGALADLTSALSERDVNIEDLQIVHSPEGGRGTVHLTVAGADAESAADAVAEHGLEAFRIA